MVDPAAPAQGEVTNASSIIRERHKSLIEHAGVTWEEM